MKNINAKQFTNSNAFQEKYLHKDIIIENDERHIFIDLEKKIKMLKDNWKNKEAFYSILREIDTQVIGENIITEEEKSVNYEDLKSANFMTKLNKNKNFKNNIHSNNLSFISNDNNKYNVNNLINNQKQRLNSPHRDDSFIAHNNSIINTNANLTSRYPSNFNNDYETEKIKSTISTGRVYNNNNQFENFNSNFNTNLTNVNTNILQRKNSVNLTSPKPFQKRYTDVHANSKLHYVNNIEKEEKLHIEPSQWNDRTNRYYYLKQQSPTILNSNYENFNNKANVNYNMDNNNFRDFKNLNNYDFTKNLSDFNITSPTSFNSNKNYNLNENYNLNKINVGNFERKNSNYKFY